MLLTKSSIIFNSALDLRDKVVVVVVCASRAVCFSSNLLKTTIQRLVPNSIEKSSFAYSTNSR
jgi:hypothetical protein